MPISSHAVCSRRACQAPPRQSSPREHLDHVVRVIASDRAEREPRDDDHLELEDRHPRAEHGEQRHDDTATRRIHADVSASAGLLLE